MLFKRVIAYIIDGFIVNLIFIVVLFIFKAFIEKILCVKIFNNQIPYNYVMLFMMSIDIIGNYSICVMNNGFTIGDKLLKIEIKSNKFFYNKLYILRFVFRTLNVYFFIISVFINIVFILINKNINNFWYDSILGLYCLNNKK